MVQLYLLTVFSLHPSEDSKSIPTGSAEAEPSLPITDHSDWAWKRRMKNPFDEIDSVQVFVAPLDPHGPFPPFFSFVLLLLLNLEFVRHRNVLEDLQLNGIGRHPSGAELWRSIEKTFHLHVGSPGHVGDVQIEALLD